MDLVAQANSPRFIYANYISDESSQLDKKNFEEWAKGLKSTYRCFVEWAENNNVDEINEHTIDINDFECWLNFLGYYREKRFRRTY